MGSRLIKKIEQHTGHSDPNKIIQHFNKDERKEGMTPAQKRENEIRAKMENYRLEGNMDPEALKKKAMDPDAIMSKEEMSAYNRLNEPNPYDDKSKYPMAGQSMSEKIKAKTVKIGDKKPVSVIEKEAEVVPFKYGSPAPSPRTTMPLKYDPSKEVRGVKPTDEDMRMMYKDTDPGEARGSGSGLFNIGDMEVGLEDMAGLGAMGSLAKGIGRKLAGKKAIPEAQSLKDFVVEKHMFNQGKTAPKPAGQLYLGPVETANKKALQKEYSRAARSGDSELVRKIREKLIKVSNPRKIDPDSIPIAEGVGSNKSYNDAFKLHRDLDKAYDTGRISDELKRRVEHFNRTSKSNNLDEATIDLVNKKANNLFNYAEGVKKYEVPDAWPPLKPKK